ncbi:MAG: competence/damage-inducible protein A, partial [Sulfurovaceae bacterium]|nr:competence/damage-inducible protein A [Sulfurovaceae bacterium]
KEAKKIITEALGERAYPHAINMANLPKDSEIIENKFNKMPAFSIDERFFFMPGFPEMSHQMILDILPKLDITKRKIYRHTLTALCKESELIEVMKTMPQNIELSSLPKIFSDGPRVALSVASENKEDADFYFNKFIEYLENNDIKYALEDEY